jgi:hypothetical protein
MCSPRNFRDWRGGGLAAALFLVGAGLVQGQTVAGFAAPSPAQKLEIKIQPGEIIGREQVVRYLIRCGTNQFLFMLPPNMRNADTSPETMVLAGTDGSYYLSLRILEPEAAPSGSEKARTLKETALERYPNARNVEEFGFIVASHDAAGIQLQQERPVVGNRLVRLLWAPCRAGTLEFTLNADPQKAALATQALECVLLSFQSNEQGQIRIIPRSDKT